MIRVLIGNLFDSQAQTLVNTVNCVGVMGKGIALEFKNRFPDMYEDYLARCKAAQVRAGQPYLFKRLTEPWILNFPTKDHWRSVSRLSDIIAGLEYLCEHGRGWGITSLAVPPLGCGQGQLEWRVVGGTLYRHLSRLDVPVELYAPHGTLAEELDEAFLSRPNGANARGDASAPASRIDPAWVALVDILARVVREPYHWPVGRTTFQKIAYFATESGIPTGLRYSRGSYGPFCGELKGVITRLVNNGLVREDPLGRMFAVRPGPTFDDARRTFQTDLARWEPVLEKIADLFLRMQTQQAEVAATVHFAARALQRRTGRQPAELDVLGEVRQWKQKRRPPLDDTEVARSIRNMNLLGWVDLRPSDELPMPEEAMAEV